MRMYFVAIFLLSQILFEKKYIHKSGVKKKHKLHCLVFVENNKQSYLAVHIYILKSDVLQ